LALYVLRKAFFTSPLVVCGHFCVHKDYYTLYIVFSSPRISRSASHFFSDTYPDNRKLKNTLHPNNKN